MRRSFWPFLVAHLPHAACKVTEKESEMAQDESDLFEAWCKLLGDFSPFLAWQPFFASIRVQGEPV